MSLPVVFRPEAEQDLLEARDWYDRRGTDLGDDFRAEIITLIERLGEMPELYAVVWNNVRRCRPKRFPYAIYYRILEDSVEVLAIVHGSRDPSVWRSRA
jgi:toxin ParE1/3/4